MLEQLSNSKITVHLQSTLRNCSGARIKHKLAAILHRLFGPFAQKLCTSPIVHFDFAGCNFGYSNFVNFSTWTSGQLKTKLRAESSQIVVEICALTVFNYLNNCCVN